MTVFPMRTRQVFPRRNENFLSWAERLFQDPLQDWPTVTPDAQLVPPLNIAEDNKSMTITLELPGVNKDDIKVDVNGNTLTISGERKWEDVKKEKNWHRVESQFGTFTRTLTLPGNLKTEAIDAVFEKGVLTLTLPKVEPSPTTKVKVRSS